MTHFDDNDDDNDENDNEDDDNEGVTLLIVPVDENEFTQEEAFNLSIHTTTFRREEENCGEHVVRAQRDED